MIQAIKDNPIPLALIGVGVGWLLLGGRKPAVPGAVERLGSTAGESVQSAYRSYPLAAGAAALVAGVITGLALPMGERERGALDVLRSGVAQGAKGTAKRVRSRTNRPAQRAS